MKPRRALAMGAVLGIAVAGACTEELLPIGHIVLYIDTDAPLPHAAGVTPDPDEPPALFDRVSVDLFPEGASEPCDGCSREFDLDAETVNAGASIVILASDGAGTAPRARLRLYRGAPLGDTPAPAIETVVQLPVLPAEGEVEVTAFLATDSLGVPTGSLDEPAAPDSGWRGSGHAGTWAPAKRVPCEDEPRAGEVCVPGGAFWMGGRTFIDFDGAAHVGVERLVVLSPFWIDAAEVTVRDFRDGGGTGATQWSGRYNGDFLVSLADYCTFTVSRDKDHDRLPVSCLDALSAAVYCANKEAALPTEAQFEYVSGALASKAHPWGEDEPECADAVYGHFGEVPDDPEVTGVCYESGQLILPEALVGDSGAYRPGRDRVEPDSAAQGAMVYDLSGNVSEWSSDLANEPGEGCWPTEGSQIFVDPECTQPGELGPVRTIRGGNFLLPSYWTRATARWTGHGGPEVGFRCARPDGSPPRPPHCMGLLGSDDPCDRCIEDQCCAELIAAGVESSDELDQCQLDHCKPACPFLGLVIECDAPQALPATGDCVTLSASVACNPVTNEGCDTAGNFTCDAYEDGFTCFPPPNDVEICGACDPQDGPFCSPGSLCSFDSVCAKYCCEDTDCGPGVCFRGDESGPLFPEIPGVGMCVEH